MVQITRGLHVFQTGKIRDIFQQERMRAKRANPPYMGLLQ